MALVLEQINFEGIAQLSYLVVDDRAGVADAIDLYLLLVVDIYLLQLALLCVPIFLPGLAAESRSRKINTKGDRAFVK